MRSTVKKVYLIRAAQFYKIGITSDVKKRLKAIQTGCPIRCEYIGYIPTHEPEVLERELHRKFQQFKTSGEWFDLGDDHVRALVVDHNLKYVTNPIASLSENTTRTSSSEALKKSRDVAADVNEVISVFDSIYPEKELTDLGISDIRKIVTQYGVESTIEAMRHLSIKMDANRMLPSLRNAAKTHKNYGRNITDKVWSLYFIVRDNEGIDEANKILSSIMAEGIDVSDGWDDFVIAIKSLYV